MEALHEKIGAEYIKAVREITEMKIFKSVDGSKEIFSALGKSHPDFDNILDAAKKMVEKGYRVYIPPNPGETRSGDCILQKKSFVGLYDVKTIIGKGSIGSRLEESADQAHRVILNIKSRYDPKDIAYEVRTYFERNKEAREIIVLKGNKALLASPKMISKTFDKNFVKRYYK